MELRELLAEDKLGGANDGVLGGGFWMVFGRVSSGFGWGFGAKMALKVKYICVLKVMFHRN